MASPAFLVRKPSCVQLAKNRSKIKSTPFMLFGHPLTGEPIRSTAGKNPEYQDFSIKNSTQYSAENRCMPAKLLQSCPTLCDPVDCSPPGSSVHVMLQARVLEWVAMPSSKNLPNPGVKPASLTSLALADRFFSPLLAPPGKPPSNHLPP